jgi:hypothetical protein
MLLTIFKTIDVLRLAHHSSECSLKFSLPCCVSVGRPEKGASSALKRACSRVFQTASNVFVANESGPAHIEDAQPLLLWAKLRLTLPLIVKVFATIFVHTHRLWGRRSQEISAPLFPQHKFDSRQGSGPCMINRQPPSKERTSYPLLLVVALVSVCYSYPPRSAMSR